MGEWLAVTVTSAIAGMGGAMAWFSNSKKELNTRMAEMEGKMEGFTDMHAEHNTQLAVVKACQVNTALILSELKEGQKEIYVKLDAVLKEVRRDR
jgi:flagellar basal body-associated protein FliL